MSQRQGFAGGFLAGAIVGGIMGGLIGSVITSRRNKNLQENDPSLLEAGGGMRFETEEEMEKARRSLENKIAQLNHAIDDVRHQLGTVNTNGVDES
jgi:Na+/glutamate symporter